MRPDLQMEDAVINRFEQMMACYGDSLLRMCFVQLRDAELARDAVQETFLKAYKQWDSFKGNSSELTWLTRIAINTCHDIRRTAWFRHMSKSVKLEDIPEPAYLETFRDDTVLQAIAKLSDKYRLPILLYYYQEMSQNEVAIVLNLTLNTVKTRLKRAREQLRVHLEGWFEE